MSTSSGAQGLIQYSDGSGGFSSTQGFSWDSGSLTLFLGDAGSLFVSSVFGQGGGLVLNSDSVSTSSITMNGDGIYAITQEVNGTLSLNTKGGGLTMDPIGNITPNCPSLNFGSTDSKWGTIFAESVVFPDSDPHVAGAAYWVAGVLTKSAG